MRIVVTGAAGFIGRRIVALAREDGHEVVALLRPRHDATALEACGAEIARADLGDPEGIDAPDALDAALAGADAVIHAAARVGWASEEAFRRDGTDATRHVVAACTRAGVPRLVHVSSCAVYGDRAVERGPVSEDAPYGYKVDRWDRYARSKIEAEGVALDAAGVGIPLVVAVRPGWVIGEGDSSTGSLLSLLRLPLYPLVGLGRNRLGVTYVGSVADACLRAATLPVEGPSRAYQVAGDWEISQRSFLEQLAAGAGLRPRFLPIPYALFFLGGWLLEALAQVVPGFDPPVSRNVVVLLGRDARFDTTRIRSELGWKPVLAADEALERTARSHATR